MYINARKSAHAPQFPQHVCASCHSPSSPLSIPAVMLHISCNADSICTRSSMSNFTASQSFSHTWRAMKTASCSDRSDSSRAVFSRPRCTPRPAAEVQSRHRFCREILFAYHVTVAFARNEKRVFLAYATRTRTYDGRYEKGRQSHTFSGLPAVLLPFRAGFSYSVALMPPFCFRRQPFRQAVPPPFQPCRSWSFSRLAFRGWRGSGRNPWRCG